MKSAQTTTDIFVYAFAVIVVGLILVFGAKKIIEIRNTGSEVEIMQFEKQLETLISSARGSGNEFIENLNLPAGFSEICFIDLDKSPSAPIQLTHPIIYDSWDAETQSNVFLVQNNKLKSFYIDNGVIKVSDNSVINCEKDNSAYICCKASDGKVKLKLSGKGRSVIVGEG